MVKAKDQTKRTMAIALFNRDLHKNNICPGNHEVDYNRGWFYFDSGKADRHGKEVGYRTQDKKLTAEADEKLKEGYEVLYSPVWNTYVLGNRVND